VLYRVGKSKYPAFRAYALTFFRIIVIPSLRGISDFSFGGSSEIPHCVQNDKDLFATLRETVAGLYSAARCFCRLRSFRRRGMGNR
jgi:hypothetical protein